MEIMKYPNGEFLQVEYFMKAELYKLKVKNR